VAAMAAVAEAAAAEQAVAYHQEQQQQQQQQQSPSRSSSRSDTQSAPWRRQIWRWDRPSSQSNSSSSSSSSSGRASGSSGSSSYVDLGRPGFEPPPPDTFRRLRHVLETYTDVTRYPRCATCTWSNPPVLHSGACALTTPHNMMWGVDSRPFLGIVLAGLPTQAGSMAWCSWYLSAGQFHNVASFT
jgi:hypothetical protein